MRNIQDTLKKASNRLALAGLPLFFASSLTYGSNSLPIDSNYITQEQQKIEAQTEPFIKRMNSHKDSVTYYFSKGIADNFFLLMSRSKCLIILRN